MADKQPSQTSESPTTEELDDKSINDLLKEYADDVKDKDIDDFLQDGDDLSDDDAFENDEALMDEAAQPKKSSGGLLGVLMLLLLCGGAGAGAWLYLNRDDGMTNITGGFKGDSLSEDDFISTMPAPEFMAPQDAPAMPAFNAPQAPEAATQNSAFDALMADDLPPPQAIVNDVPAQTPEVVVVTEETAPVTAPVEAPKANTEAAVDAWLSGSDSVMDEPVSKLPPITEKPVAEVKAKPVKIEASEQPRKAASTPAATTPAAPRATSGSESALPPPYLAIQARKQGREPGAVAPVAPVATPVADDVAGYVRGSTAATEPAQTRATGIYRDLVSSGGGAIELNNGVPVPAAPLAVPPAAASAYQQPAVTPTQQNVEYAAPTAPVQGKLAISGGRSMPDGRQVTTTVQTPARAAAPVVSTGAVTIVDETVVMVPNAPVSMPAAPIATPVATPVATPSAASQSPAASLLREAQAAEAAGRAEQAVTLYQKALEADAVHGGGRSIDRGAVYDRIGALRAGR